MTHLHELSSPHLLPPTPFASAYGPVASKAVQVMPVWPVRNAEDSDGQWDFALSLYKSSMAHEVEIGGQTKADHRLAVAKQEYHESSWKYTL